MNPQHVTIERKQSVSALLPRRPIMGLLSLLTVLFLLAVGTSPVHSQQESPVDDDDNRDPFSFASVTAGRVDGSDFTQLSRFCTERVADPELDIRGDDDSEQRLDDLLEQIRDACRSFSFLEAAEQSHVFMHEVAAKLQDMQDRLSAVNAECAPPPILYANWQAHFRSIQSALEGFGQQQPDQEQQEAIDRQLQMVLAAVAYYEVYMRELCGLYMEYDQRKTALAEDHERSLQRLVSAVTSLVGIDIETLDLSNVAKHLGSGPDAGDAFQVYIAQRLPPDWSTTQRVRFAAALALMDRYVRRDTILQLAEGRDFDQVLDVVLPSGGYVYVDFDSHVSTTPDAATALMEAQHRSRFLRGVAFGRHPDGEYMTLNNPQRGVRPLLQRVDGEALLQASLEIANGEVLLAQDQIRGERAPTVPGFLRHRFEMVGDVVVERRWSHREEISEFDSPNGPTQRYLRHMADRMQDAAIAACAVRLSDPNEARVTFLDLAPESLDVFEEVFLAGVSADMCRPGSRGLWGVFEAALSAKHADIFKDEEDDFALRYARRYHRLDYIATNVMQDRWDRDNSGARERRGRIETPGASRPLRRSLQGKRNSHS